MSDLAGVAESVIMDVTGHSTRAMFDRYNTVDSHDREEAVHQLKDYFENVARSACQGNSGEVTP